MTDKTPPDYDSFADLEPARGYFGVVDRVGGDFVVTGWMLTPPPIELSSFALYLNQKLVGQVEAEIPSAGFDEVRHEGEPKVFTFQLKPTPAIPDFSRIEVLGYAGGESLRRLTTLYRGNLETSVPTPPEQLTYRVTGNRIGKQVKESGLRCAVNFLDAVGQHRDLTSVRRLLDWGCGCGRVTVQLMDALSDYEGLEIDGCDIDAEAIAWCNQRLRRDRFHQINPFPPLSWADSFFDVVVSCSVFTHLTEEVQQLWLQELKRVLAPGGMLLASVNSHFPNGRIPAQGISDETMDPMLNGIAPSGYYRGTIQSREYTTSRWSNVFEILDFIERGIEGTQDLVVMRKPL